MRAVAVAVALGFVAIGASGCGRMQAVPVGAAAAGGAPVGGAPVGGAAVSGAYSSSKAATASAAFLQAKPGQAILVRGALAFRGLPFFAPNALSGLAGEYLVAPPSGPTFRIRVWFTRASLYFGPSWQRGTMGHFTLYSSNRVASGAIVFALATDSYELLVELPRDDPGLRRFVAAFGDSFALFFSEATTDADISFPAFVDYVP